MVSLLDGHDQYPHGVKGRNADIESGAGRGWLELIGDVSASADELERRWNAARTLGRARAHCDRAGAVERHPVSPVARSRGAPRRPRSGLSVRRHAQRVPTSRTQADGNALDGPPADGDDIAARCGAGCSTTRTPRVADGPRRDRRTRTRVDLLDRSRSAEERRIEFVGAPDEPAGRTVQLADVTLQRRSVRSQRFESSGRGGARPRGAAGMMVQLHHAARLDRRRKLSEPMCATPILIAEWMAGHMGDLLEHGGTAISRYGNRRSESAPGRQGQGSTAMMSRCSSEVVASTYVSPMGRNPCAS